MVSVSYSTAWTFNPAHDQSLMKLPDYIQSVCAANNLRETALLLLQSGDPANYVDRHVAEPPPGLTLDAACAAGFALLREWTRDAASLVQLGIVASKPLLIIDQTWLKALPDAPPPHVLVTITRAENSDRLPPDHLEAAPSSKADCPCRELLSGDLATVGVYKVAACPERESLGGWLFRFEIPVP